VLRLLLLQLLLGARTNASRAPLLQAVADDGVIDLAEASRELAHV